MQEYTVIAVTWFIWCKGMNIFRMKQISNGKYLCIESNLTLQLYDKACVIACVCAEYAIKVQL